MNLSSDNIRREDLNTTSIINQQTSSIKKGMTNNYNSNKILPKNQTQLINVNRNERLQLSKPFSNQQN